uniref:Reverse transcriptase domain-containing protein n=1 Tax=Trichuris muris TaxID=70415 RepID=A0A5S6Q5S9_TRIMR
MFCLKQGNYFNFQGRFYRQNRGIPMGSSLSPVLAEVFMENLEEIAFKTVNPDYCPKFFKRYVDDVFAVVKKGNEDAFLNQLSSLFPGIILFTMEVENNNELPFVDMKIIKRATN